MMVLHRITYTKEIHALFCEMFTPPPPGSVDSMDPSNLAQGPSLEEVGHGRCGGVFYESIK